MIEPQDIYEIEQAIRASGAFTLRDVALVIRGTYRGNAVTINLHKEDFLTYGPRVAVERLKEAVQMLEEAMG